MSTFAESCQQLVTEIKGKESSWKKRDDKVWTIRAQTYFDLRTTRKERLARAKDEVAFLKKLGEEVYVANVDEPLDQTDIELYQDRLTDLEAGIKILESVK